jgi:hypothetical protein
MSVSAPGEGERRTCLDRRFKPKLHTRTLDIRLHERRFHRVQMRLMNLAVFSSFSKGILPLIFVLTLLNKL